MLAFISFWRVAAIVLNDMGSSAFYAGAISEHFVGKTAPWFVLAIMLLAGTVAALYIESCGMFVRGGVYRVVKENTEPCPSWLITRMVPPCACTTAFAIARPIPVPCTE